MIQTCQCQCCKNRIPSDSTFAASGKLLLEHALVVQNEKLQSELDEARRDKAETLKRLRARVLGYSASRNVFRVIDDEIQKADPSYKPNYSARARSKVVIERNELVEKLRVKLATANALLEKALDILLFYAGEENWHESESFNERMRITNIDGRTVKGDLIVGGKAAFKAIKEIELHRGKNG